MNDLDSLPEHVAIVMDGNGRWATRQGRARSFGHLAGASVAIETYRRCRDLGIRHLTLFAFSLANWRRPPEEIDTLMEIFANFAWSQRNDFIARNIRFRVLGDLRSLPERTAKNLAATMTATAHLDGMVLSMAIAYGGRQDLLDGVRGLLAEAQAGALELEQVDERALRRHMSTAGMPDPDLLIRTGGELRLSDFLTFESAFTEFVFSDVLWPEFSADELRHALVQYQNRQRRFGYATAAEYHQAHAAAAGV